MSYRYCPKCDNRYKSYEDCPECGIRLQQPNVNNDQNVNGNRNQAVQVGGDNHGDIIIQQSHTVNEDTKTLISRESIKPITIGQHQVKGWWLGLIGAFTAILGLVAQILSVINKFQSLTTTGISQQSTPIVQLFSVFSFMAIIVVGAFLIRVTILLKRKRHVAFWFGKTVERTEDGRLFWTKINGTCGQCQRPVTVKPSGNLSLITCSYNDKHNIEFDWGIFDDVGDEYQRITKE